MDAVPKSLLTILDSLCINNNLTSWRVIGGSDKITLTVHFSETTTASGNNDIPIAYKKKSPSQVTRDTARREQWQARHNNRQRTLNLDLQNAYTGSTENTNTEDDTKQIVVPLYTMEQNVDFNNYQNVLNDDNKEKDTKPKRKRHSSIGLQVDSTYEMTFNEQAINQEETDTLQTLNNFTKCEESDNSTLSSEMDNYPIQTNKVYSEETLPSDSLGNHPMCPKCSMLLSTSLINTNIFFCARCLYVHMEDT